MGIRGIPPLGHGRRVVDDVYQVSQYGPGARLGRAELIPTPFRGGSFASPLSPVITSGRTDLVQPYPVNLPLRGGYDRLRVPLEPYERLERDQHVGSLDRNVASLRPLSLDPYSPQRRQSEDWEYLDTLRHHRDICGNSWSSCQCNFGHQSLPFKTKDITIRGKTYPLRKSFLDDNGKFEKDIQTYTEKKNDKTVPNEVIRHMVCLINDLPISPSSILDLVTLNILASNVGVKSAVKSSQDYIERYTSGDASGRDSGLGGNELIEICASIFLSSRVDDGLMEWVKEYLKKGGAADRMAKASGFRALERDHPEVIVSIETLLGMREKPDDDGLRIQ